MEKINIVKAHYVFLLILLLTPFLFACFANDPNETKTFTLNKGTVHFSFEYRSFYHVKEFHPGADTGLPTKDIAYVNLMSPFNNQIKDYTYIEIIADKPDRLVPDAKSGIERAERNASSWPDYQLLNKSELFVDGYQAYRIDYLQRNPLPVDRGLVKPLITVYREVDFDTQGFVWMIQISSDNSTAEAERSDFEQILRTFKVLD
jgi:hypothetical protein